VEVSRQRSRSLWLGVDTEVVLVYDVRYFGFSRVIVNCVYILKLGIDSLENKRMLKQHKCI